MSDNTDENTPQIYKAEGIVYHCAICERFIQVPFVEKLVSMEVDQEFIDWQNKMKDLYGNKYNLIHDRECICSLCVPEKIDNYQTVLNNSKLFTKIYIAKKLHEDKFKLWANMIVKFMNDHVKWAELDFSLDSFDQKCVSNLLKDEDIYDDVNKQLQRITEYIDNNHDKITKYFYKRLRHKEIESTIFQYSMSEEMPIYNAIKNITENNTWNDEEIFLRKCKTRGTSEYTYLDSSDNKTKFIHLDKANAINNDHIKMYDYLEINTKEFTGFDNKKFDIVDMLHFVLDQRETIGLIVRIIFDTLNERIIAKRNKAERRARYEAETGLKATLSEKERKNTNE